MSRAIIIGAGIGGLATAVRLAVKGFRVQVFEQADKPGGKISELHDKGFRWDTGPSLFTLPELANELFELAGENPTDYLSYKQIDPICKYFYPDGTQFNAHANAALFAKELEEKVGEPANNTTTFLKKYNDLYKLASPVFLFNSFHKLKNFMKPEFKQTLFKLHKLDSFRTMDYRNKRWFKTKYAAQLFNRYATYNGSNPYETPATLNMIAHLEHNLGGYFPDKGMYQVALAVYELAVRLGVQFRFNSRVNKIVYSKNKITGVEIDNEIIPSDMVVSNVDAATFYHHLMPNVKKPKSIINKELSSSGIIFYWGVNKQFASLELHNILFSANYRAEFDAIFKEKTIYQDPTVYLFISSKLVKTDAPAGSENWFVMINTPANYGQKWDDLIAIARQRIIKTINAHLGIKIEEHIISEHVASPITIEQNTASWKGALYGNASNSMLSAFNRHANFSRKFKNLYFVGGSVHPGGGIPLCLCSAKIVDELIDEPLTKNNP